MSPGGGSVGQRAGLSLPPPPGLLRPQHHFQAGSLHMKQRGPGQAPAPVYLGRIELVSLQTSCKALLLKGYSQPPFGAAEGKRSSFLKETRQLFPNEDERNARQAKTHTVNILWNSSSVSASLWAKCSAN